MEKLLNSKETLEMIENLDMGKLKLEDMPEIDLYMDQVIQLFESRLSNTKRNEKDKVMTKTMINNYAKAKLLMSIKNKRYSKEHLILMSLIYELKGSLSISDIKLLFDNIIEKYENNERYDLRGLYNQYLQETERDNEVVLDNIKKKIENIEDGDFEEKFLLISSLISISNMYRKVGELLIDEYFGKGESENEK